ncbi:type VII secretion integral membrane protein EccD [Nocardioides sp. HDW12B]|nr:type VII secretion integral membrane protein EccD [Nocardioides sp. HDW12B]
MEEPTSAAAPGASLVRVTVVGGGRRADLVLPATLPVAELLPELCRTVGVLDPATAYAGYELHASDGRRLSGEAGLTLQGVEDGAVLSVVVGADQRPPRVYDDIVEAMADAVEGDLQPWDPASGRRTALSAGALLLGLGGLALALQRPDPVAGAAAGVGALLLLAAALTLARVRAEHTAALVLAWTSAFYAGVAGLTVVDSGPVLELPLAATGGGVLLVGVIAFFGLVQRRALMLPAAVVGAVLAVGSGLAQATDLDPANVYVVALVVVVLAGSALPWFALGSTGTNVEQAHTHADLTAEPADIDPDAVRAGARMGHEVLLAVTATVGILLVLVSPLAVGLGVTGALVVVMSSVALMLRTRQYRVGSEVAVGLVCGVAGLAATAAAALLLQSSWHVGLALVLAAAAAVLLVSTLVPMPPSVRRGRLGDVAELVALVSLLPLLVVAIGVVGAV